MQVKRKSKLLWLWELPGIPSPGDREVKRSRKGKSKAGKALEDFSHPSLPSWAAPPTPGQEKHKKPGNGEDRISF